MILETGQMLSTAYQRHCGIDEQLYNVFKSKLKDVNTKKGTIINWLNDSKIKFYSYPLKQKKIILYTILHQ